MRIMYFCLTITLSVSGIAYAATMSGTTYSITSSVIGGGGAQMTSPTGTYELNGTIGQPTPLADTGKPILNLSGTVELKPGFWNTVNRVCSFDSAPFDKDIDGVDLAAYALAGDFSKIQQFATFFSKNCQ